MSDLTREQVTNWISNVTAPGPVLAVNAGASRRIGESWLRLLTRAEKAEAERDEARAEVERLTTLVGRHDSTGLNHLAEAEAAWVARDAMETALVEARTEVAELRVALAACADELDGWGWGDFHYGPQPQERRVVEAVAAARAALTPVPHEEVESTP